MVVRCPKCKTKLNVPDDRISPDGSRFKCPKCTTILLVKKPSRAPKQLDKNKILVALSDPATVQRAESVLAADGFTVVTATDGVDAMIKATKELPYTAVIDVALPKIYGFEVCKRIKTREETKEMKVLLFTSVYDKDKYKRQPESLYGADDYIEGHQIDENLLEKVHALIKGAVPAPAERKEPPGREEPQEQAPAGAPAVSAAVSPDDDWVGKAKRLTRTILADVFLYNPQKAEDALRSGNFMTVFAQELQEGKRLYESRIPQNVRDKGDIFEQEMARFLEEKKKSLNI